MDVTDPLPVEPIPVAAYATPVRRPLRVARLVARLLFVGMVAVVTAVGALLGLLGLYVAVASGPGFNARRFAFGSVGLTCVVTVAAMACWLAGLVRHARDRPA